VQEGKKQVVEQTKAALSKQVAELERKLKESEMHNKRLKNDILVAREDKFKYKQMLENETAKLRKVQQSFGPEDNLLLPLTQMQLG